MTAMLRPFVMPVLMLAPLTLLTQISISDNDILSLKGTTRDVLVPDEESDAALVPIGPGGMNQIWDYQNVNTINNIEGEVEYQDPAGGYRADLFPTANFRQRISAESDSGMIIIDNYMNVTPNQLRTLGSAGNFAGFESIEIDQDNVAPLPMTYGTSWLSVSNDTSDQFGFVTITLDSSWNTIDGYGMLLLPTGDFECLRLREFNKTISKSTFNGVPIGFPDTMERVFYTWLSKAHLLTFSVDSTDNGMGEVNLVVMGEVSSAVTATGDLPEVFALEQNYPNPFYPVTTIRFDVPQQTHVTLTIHDLVGREVATLVDELLPRGSFTRNWHAEGIPSGIYLYRLLAGNHVEMKKMTLMR